MLYLPITYKLFGQQWTIRAAQGIELQDELGECHSDRHEIVINPNQTDQSAQHTMLHEIIHSIEQKMHLELTERQVDCIALGILHLFNENPELVDILTPGEKE
jgi:predicted Zn-dependent protease